MKKALYLGSDPSFYLYEGELIHYPLLDLRPRSLSDPQLQEALSLLPCYTHLLFTSKHAIDFFFDRIRELGYGPEDVVNKAICALA